jgi:hypothetical protein
VLAANVRRVLTFPDAMRKKVVEEYNRRQNFVVGFPAFRRIQSLVRLNECKFGVPRR